MVYSNVGLVLIIPVTVVQNATLSRNLTMLTGRISHVPTPVRWMLKLRSDLYTCKAEERAETYLRAEWTFPLYILPFYHGGGKVVPS